MLLVHLRPDPLIQLCCCSAFRLLHRIHVAPSVGTWWTYKPIMFLHARALLHALFVMSSFASNENITLITKLCYNSCAFRFNQAAVGCLYAAPALYITSKSSSSNQNSAVQPSALYSYSKLRPESKPNQSPKQLVPKCHPLLGVVKHKECATGHCIS